MTPSTQEQLPNIIFILADDLGYGDVEYNGGPANTPNLNAMASGPHSINFTRFYSGSPVCSPTRGTILTGRNHNRYCMWSANTIGRGCNGSDFTCPAKMPLPTSEVTVAEILKSRGYRTAVFGKWHLGDLKPIPGGSTRWPTSHPGQHGFDVWEVTERSTPTANPNCACFTSISSSLCKIGHYRRREDPPCTNYHSGNGSDTDVLTSYNRPIIGDDSDFIVQQFSTFLNDTVYTRQPFFAYISFHAVHKRFIATSTYAAPYTQNSGYAKNVVDYYGTITAMDAAVGRVRQLLNHYNISHNTMVWFTSDNGPERQSPGLTAGLRGRKRDLYEGGIRVPGIIEWPARIHENHVSNIPVVTTDFLPTVCNIIGIATPQQRVLDGISILPILERQTESRSTPIHWLFKVTNNFNSRHTAVIMDNQYKAFIDYKRGRVFRKFLYDLLSDPGEEVDLSEQDPARLQSMQNQLELWRLSVINSAETEVGCLATPN